MNLSQHFTFAEMTTTSQEAWKPLQAQPSVEVLASLTALCERVLEPIRARFGPVSIHSGYRCVGLNAAIGGSKTSQHVAGQAADFHCAGAGLPEVYDWIRHESGIKVGELILESHTPGVPVWIHVSLPTAKIHDEYLTFDGSKYHTAPA